MTTRHKVSGYLASLGILLLSAARATNPPPPIPPSPGPDRTAEFIATCTVIWQELLGRPIDPAGLESCLNQARAGRTAHEVRADVQAGDEYKGRQEALKHSKARQGLVRLDRRVFVDDDGPFLGVGASLFWASWGYEHDRARLEQNLKFLSRKVDYIRVLGVVGPSGWADRMVSARSLLESGTIGGLTDLAYDTYGLRIEWTIFGGIETTPTSSDREALVRRFAAVLASRAQKVIHFEVTNEGWATGLGGDAGRAEGRRYAQILRESTSNRVAITAPENLGDAAHLWYDGSAADLFTSHLDRSTNGTGGVFRPIRQARDMVDQPLAWTSNEPIGPQSSVAEDDDPTRLALSAAYTWLCHGAGYVLHTGAGVRGGGLEDLARGRVVNMWEVSRISETLDAIAAVRKILPADLPNWVWRNNNPNFPEYPFQTNPLVDEANLLRAFAAIAPDGRFVAIPIDVKRPTLFTAKRAMAFDVIEPATAAVRSHQELVAGQTFTLEPTPGAIFKGQFR